MKGFVPNQIQLIYFYLNLNIIFSALSSFMPYIINCKIEVFAHSRNVCVVMQFESVLIHHMWGHWASLQPSSAAL